MKDFSKAIFKIMTSTGSGTGFYVADKDIFITNHHVIAGEKQVALQGQNRRRFLGNVIYVNNELDLAFIRSEQKPADVPSITLNADTPIDSLQKIYVHGFPFGMPYTITEGVISSAEQLLNGRKFIQTDAAVNPGNSGGPMLSSEGHLIAVTTSKLTQADNVGFGIPVQQVLQEFKEFKPTNPNTYHVKCDSCSLLLTEKTEFCPHCGNDIDPVVFEHFDLSLFANFVEESLNLMGLNPILARAGKDYWEFHNGSALIRIFVFKSNYLVATSPLNRLPKGDLKELLTYILDKKQVNAPYTLGISDNHIYVSYRVHLSDIFSEKKESIKKALSQLPQKADELDSFFNQKYDCPHSAEAIQD